MSVEAHHIDPPVRIGLLGLGEVGLCHAAAYAGVPAVRAVAGADIDPQRVASASASFGFQGYESLAAMVAAEDLEAVCVLTPAASHEADVRQAAAAGLHVLCEKPLTLSLASAARMAAACRDAGVMLAYGASYRHIPALIEARTLIAAGAIGDVLFLRETVIGGSGDEARQALGPHHYPHGGIGGGGMGLVDHGIHLIDAFAWLIGSPIEQAFGRGNISGHLAKPEYATLRFANGAVGHLLYEDGSFPGDLPSEGLFGHGAGWSADGAVAAGDWHPAPATIFVHGTAGMLRIHPYAHRLFMRSAAGLREIEIVGDPPPAHFGAQIGNFARAIRGREPLAADMAAAENALRALLAIYASERANRALRPDEVHEEDAFPLAKEPSIGTILTAA